MTTRQDKHITVKHTVIPSWSRSECANHFLTSRNESFDMYRTQAMQWYPSLYRLTLGEGSIRLFCEPVLNRDTQNQCATPE